MTATAQRPKGRTPRVPLPAGLGLIKGGADYKHVLYLFGLSDGGIKFGITRNPRNRVGQIHRSAIGPVAWAHLMGCRFDRVTAAYIVEQRALALAAGFGSRRDGHAEVIDGLTKDEAIACMRHALRCTEPTPAEQG